MDVRKYTHVQFSAVISHWAQLMNVYLALITITSVQNAEFSSIFLLNAIVLAPTVEQQKLFLKVTSKNDLTTKYKIYFASSFLQT